MSRLVFHRYSVQLLSQVPSFISSNFKCTKAESSITLPYVSLPIAGLTESISKNESAEKKLARPTWICSDAILSMLLIYGPDQVKLEIWKVKSIVCENLPEHLKYRANLPLDYVKFGSASIVDFEMLAYRCPHFVTEISFSVEIPSKQVSKL